MMYRYNSSAKREGRRVKIGVISDTHLTGYDTRLKSLLDSYFRDVDFILHAGDLVDIRVLDSFEGKEVKAVCGNMDPLSVRTSLPDRLILEIERFRIGLMHGWGMPFNLEQKLLKELGHVDCLVYGHSHKPVNRMKNGTLFFNPGSAVDRRFTTSNTVGILEIGTRIKGEIIELRD
jgi:putative phosphoesterase